MERSQRLLSLVAMLLEARDPVPWSDIKAAFRDDYGSGSDAASERKFERDKADLLDMGIPLSFVRPGEDLEHEGYVLDREQFYLPALRLAPEELAVLYVAGSAAVAQDGFPFRDDLVSALRKIAFVDPKEGERGAQHVVVANPALSRDPQLAEKVKDLSDAAVRRKAVDIVYHTMSRDDETRRRIDPYGVVYSRGAWLCVAYCHLREDLRVFAVDRIKRWQTNQLKPRIADFEVPAGFDLAAYAARQSWEYAVHDPLQAQVRLKPSIAFQARALFGDKAEIVDEGKRGVRVKLTVTDSEGLVKHVLSLGDRAEVIAPPRLRKMARDRLASLVKTVSRTRT